jgi:O-succinylbenzoate synthase
MKIDSIEVRRVAYRLKEPFPLPNGVIEDRQTLVVRVRTPASEGWGECYALTYPYPYPDYLDSAEHVLREFLIPPVLAAADDVTAPRVGPLTAGLRGHRFARSALETAVLDAELRAGGLSLASYLGSVSDEVVAGVSLPMYPQVDDVVKAVQSALEEGYLRVKFRIKPGFDVEPVRAARALGDGFSLHVDANGAYGAEHMAQLRKLDDLGLDMLEQPFAPEDIRTHELLARQIHTPICLDESIVSAKVAADAIVRGAAQMVALKPLRVGGYLESRRIHDVCRALDAPMFCSGMLESGISLAANLALASLPGFTLAADLWSPERYFEQDFVAPFPLVDGRLAVPQGAGIGVDVLPDVLDELTVSTHELTPA